MDGLKTEAKPDFGVMRFWEGRGKQVQATKGSDHKQKHDESLGSVDFHWRTFLISEC